MYLRSQESDSVRCYHGLGQRCRIGGVDEGLERLRADLDDGRWDERYGSLMDRTELDLGYRVIVAELPKT